MRYFDHNATHPLSGVARAAWLDAIDRHPANPASSHRLGGRAEAALEAAREQLAGYLGCSAFDIVWTSGATESNNAILHHFSRTGEGDVWISAIEHPCILAAARHWLPGRHRLMPVGRDGVLDLEWLERELPRRRVKAVIAMAANNETGVLQPWSKVREVCRAHAVPYVCDAAQWIGRLPATGLGACEFISGCAHKFGGPAGVGFLKCPKGFRPFIHGGDQEHGLRAGTANLAGVLAMLAALADREQRMASGALSAMEAVRARFAAGLKAALPGAEVLGEGAACLWNTVTALMPAAADCRRRWVVKLDKLGFAVSTGSACASGKELPSHVVTAMGYPPDSSDRMLRFSAGWETTEADWSALKEGLVVAAAELGAAGTAGFKPA